jgi:hypothetical protein
MVSWCPGVAKSTWNIFLRIQSNYQRPAIKNNHSKAIGSHAENNQAHNEGYLSSLFHIKLKRVD